MVEAIDDLAKTCVEEIVIQIGYSTYEPCFTKWFRFETPARIQEFISQAEIVITHGGFGIISECLRKGKRVVACARNAKLGEAVNPQIELVTYLAELNLVIPLLDFANLEKSIEKARHIPLPNWSFESKIPELVATFIHTGSSV